MHQRANCHVTSEGTIVKSMEEVTVTFHVRWPSEARPPKRRGNLLPKPLQLTIRS